MSGFGIGRHRRGFTLVEIMIAILIIAILLAIAIPNFLRTRDVSRARACQANLRQIETAKEQWGMDNRKTGDDIPTVTDLVTEYMKGSEDTLSPCPTGGDYDVGNMTTRPSCTFGDGGDAEAYNDHTL